MFSGLKFWWLTRNLMPALKDKDSFVRRRDAAEALGKLGDARAVEPLMAALKEDASMRQAAVQALDTVYPNWRESEGARGVTCLSVEQIRALAWRGDSQAVKPLRAVLGDPSDELRETA